MPRRFLSTVLLFTAMVALVSCGDDKPRVYTVSKDAPAAPVASSRTPAAMPPDTPPAGGDNVQWTLPAGWTRAPEAGAMRYATLSVGQGDTQFQVAVSQLGGQAGGLLPNINRWRGQLGLEPISENELRDQVKMFDAGGVPGLLIDLQQPEPGDQRMLVAMFIQSSQTWFFKATAPSAVAAAHEQAFGDLVRSVRFGGPDTNPSRAGSQLSWTTPEGWQPVTDLTLPRVAAFTVPNADGEAGEVTVIVLAGGGGDLMANINRWRSQIGLESIKALDEQPVARLDIDGAAAGMIDLIGPADEYDSDAGKRLLVAMAPRGDATWFIKFTGTHGLIKANKTKFAQLLASLRFGAHQPS